MDGGTLLAVRFLSFFVSCFLTTVFSIQALTQALVFKLSFCKLQTAAIFDIWMSDPGHYVGFSWISCSCSRWSDSWWDDGSIVRGIRHNLEGHKYEQT